MGFLDDLKKYAGAGFAQINPFDDDETWDTKVRGVKPGTPKRVSTPPPRIQKKPEQFKGFSLDEGKNKTIFGWNAAALLPKQYEKVYGLKTDRDIKSTPKDFVGEFDKINPDFQKKYVSDLEELAKDNKDPAAINSLKTLREAGKFKGDTADFAAGASERFYGGLTRGTLRTADFFLPGKNTFGLEQEADRQESPRQFTEAGKQGETAGTVGKGVLDLAALAVPAAKIDQAAKTNKFYQLLAGGNKFSKGVGYLGRVGAGSLPTSAIYDVQERGRGNQPDLKTDVGVGLALDLATPPVLGAVAKGIKPFRGAARSIINTAGKTIDNAGINQVAERSPDVIAIDEHVRLLNKQRENLLGRGLSENNPAVQKNAEAVRNALTAKQQAKQQVAQGGYAKTPDYGMDHRPSNSTPAHDLEQNAPDIYDRPDYYRTGDDLADTESIQSIQAMRGNPDAKITIYRAGPKNELNNSDWVTLSKRYAQQAATDEGVPVHSFKVKAKDLGWPADSINEFGYFGKSKKPNLLSDETGSIKVWGKDTPLPSEGSDSLKSFTEALNKQGATKEEVLTAINRSLNSENPSQREAAQRALDEINTTYGSPEAFADQAVSGVPGRSQVQEATANLEEASRLREQAPVSVTPEQAAQGIRDKSFYDDYISETEAWLNGVKDASARSGSRAPQNKAPAIEETVPEPGTQPAQLSNSSRLDQAADIPGQGSSYAQNTPKQIKVKGPMNPEDYAKRYGKEGPPGKNVKVNPFTMPEADFTQWTDKGALGLGRETLERNLDRVAGKDAPAIKKFLVEASRENETNRANFLNDMRNQVKEDIVGTLGIRAGTEDSALIQKFGEKQPGIDEQFLQNAVGAERAQKIVAASEYFRKAYDNLLDNWNGVRSKYGYKAVPKRDDYFRHFQEINDTINQVGAILRQEDLPTSISGVTDIFKPGKPFSTAELRRRGNKTTEDAIKGFDNYLDTVSRQIYHLDTIQRGRSIEKAIRSQAEGLENGPRFTGSGEDAEEISQIELPNFVANLGEWVNSVSGKKTKIDRAAEAFLGRKVYGAVDTLRRQTSANMVGGNIASAFSNFIPFTQSLSTTGKKAFVKGLFDTLSTPLGKGSLTSIDGVQSKFLTRRFVKEGIDIRGIRKASNIASTPFEAVDKFTARSVVAGKYYEGLAKNLSPEQAMKAADDYGSKVLADRSLGQMPNLMNTKTAGFVNQFQTEINNQVSFLMRDIPELKGGNKAKIAGALSQFVLFSYMFNEGYEKAMGRRPQIDPIQAVLNVSGQENPDADSGQNLKSATENIAGGLPFSSIFTGGRLPINAMFPDFGAGKTALENAISGEGAVGKNAYKAVSGPLAYGLPPFGGGQVKKTVESLNTLTKGYSETPSGKVRFTTEGSSVADKLKSLLFGQYSSDAGRGYIKGGIKPLGEGDSEMLKSIAPNKRKEFFESVKAEQLMKARLDAGKPAQITDDTKLNDILNRVMKKTEKTNVVPQYDVDKKISIRGADVELKPEQRYNLQTEITQEIGSKWSQAVQSNGFKKLDAKGKADMLLDIKRDTTAAVKDKYARENKLGPFKPGFSGRTDNISSNEQRVLDDDINYEGYASKSRSAGEGYSATELPADLSQESLDFFNKYDAMTSDERERWFDKTPDAEYQYAKAEFEREEKAGTLTRAERIREEKSLAKEKIGSKYSKDVRDIYSLSKSDIAGLLEEAPDGKKLAKQLLAYDQELYGKGLVSYAKFKNGFGSSSGGGSGRKAAVFTPPKSSSVDIASAYNALASLLSQAKVTGKKKKGISAS